jgi:hypothetical protein
LFFFWQSGGALMCVRVPANRFYPIIIQLERERERDARRWLKRRSLSTFWGLLMNEPARPIVGAETKSPQTGNENEK